MTDSLTGQALLVRPGHMPHSPDALFLVHPLGAAANQYQNLRRHRFARRFLPECFLGELTA